MAAREIPLLKFLQVTLDVSGNGTVEMGPSLNGVTWHVTSIAISVEPRPSTSEPECAVYQKGTFIGGSYSGSLDSANGSWELQTQEKIKAVWTGGDAGKTATLTLMGKETIIGG